MDSKPKIQTYYRDKDPHANVKFAISGIFSVITITFSLLNKNNYSPVAFVIVPILCGIVLLIAFFDSRMFDHALRAHVLSKQSLITPVHGDIPLFLIQTDLIAQQLEVTAEMYTAIEIGDHVYIEYSPFSKMVKKMRKEI